MPRMNLTHSPTGRSHVLAQHDGCPRDAFPIHSSGIAVATVNRKHGPATRVDSLHHGRHVASGIEQHRKEMQRNRVRWEDKPALRAIYREFHRLIAAHLAPLESGAIVELGSGVADIRDVIPGCIRTDLFAHPDVARVENAYRLSFADSTVASLILFDVFHHLRYPGEAFAEFRRVLLPRGRVIMFEPCISMLGLLVYGLYHPEPLGLRTPIEWMAPAGWSPAETGYYAAQATAWRMFRKGEHRAEMSGWRTVTVCRLASLSYAASGGYTRPQFFPTAALPLMLGLDRILGRLPSFFATRMLVAVDKIPGNGE